MCLWYCEVCLNGDKAPPTARNNVSLCKTDFVILTPATAGRIFPPGRSQDLLASLDRKAEGGWEPMVRTTPTLFPINVLISLADNTPLLAKPSVLPLGNASAVGVTVR